MHRSRRAFLIVSLLVWSCADEEPPPPPAEAPLLAPPVELAQALIVPAGPLALGAETCTRPLRFQGKVAGDAGKKVRLEVEIRAAAEPLQGAATHASQYVDAGLAAFEESTDLALGSGYKWQARAAEEGGRASAWVAFGGNGDEPDFALCADDVMQFTPATVAVQAPAGVSTAGWKIHAGLMTSAPVEGGAATVHVLDDQPQLLFAVSADGKMTLMALKPAGWPTVTMTPQTTANAMAVLTGVLAREYVDGPLLVTAAMDETTELTAAAELIAAKLAQSNDALADPDVSAAIRDGAVAARILLEGRLPSDKIRIEPDARFTEVGGMYFEKIIPLHDGEITYKITNRKARWLFAAVEDEEGRELKTQGISPASLGGLLPPELPKDVATTFGFPLASNRAARMKVYGPGMEVTREWSAETQSSRDRVIRPTVYTILDSFVVPIVGLVVRLHTADSGVGKGFTAELREKMWKVIGKEALLVNKVMEGEIIEVMLKISSRSLTAFFTNEEGIRDEVLKDLGKGVLADVAVQAGAYFIPIIGQLKLAVEIGERLAQILKAAYDVFSAPLLTVFEIANLPPDVDISASPTEGLVPLTVNFAVINNEVTGVLTHFDWDFDDDGTWDYSSNSVPTTTKKYEEVGTYHVRLRVFDDDGATNSDKVVEIKVVKPGLEVIHDVGTPSGFVSYGPERGPFNPPSKSYYLRSSIDMAGALIDWKAEAISANDWLKVEPDAGTASYSYTTVRVSIDQEKAAQLPPGAWPGRIEFTNLTNGDGDASRIVTLVIGPRVTVTPADDVDITGSMGGPFAPASQEYTLTSDAGTTVPFKVSHNTGWLTLSATTGVATPSGARVTVSVNQAAAAALTPADYPGVVSFQANDTIGAILAERKFTLTVTADSASGELDESFNTVIDPGWVGLGAGATAWAMALDSQDRLIVAGTMDKPGPDYYDVAVWRILPDGSFDTSFARDGSTTFDGLNGGPGRRDGLYAVAVDAQDRIVIAGYANNAVNADLLVGRLEVDGSADTDFGARGWFTHAHAVNRGGDDYDVAYDVILDAQGRIVVTGASKVSGTDDEDMVVWRITPAGQLDPTFNGRGWVTHDRAAGGTPGRPIDYGNGVAIDRQGRIVVGGTSMGGTPTINHYAMAIWRYLPDGALDTSFAGRGWLTDRGRLGQVNQDYAAEIVLDAQDRPTVAGWGRNPTDFDVAVWRYTADGASDLGFGTNGIATYAGSTSRSQDGANALATDSRGRLIIAGWDGTGILRFTENGVLDPAFGGGDGRFVPGGEGLAVKVDRQGRIYYATSRFIARIK